MPAWVQVFLGFAAYGAVHSVLLTPWARRGLEALVGRRSFQGLFRLFFNVQAVGLLVLYAVWAAGRPDRELFRVGGAGAWLLWGVRLAGLGFIARCASSLGLSAFLGFDDLRAWREGRPPPGDGVETGVLAVGGPYRWVRHPMYSAGFAVLWADPRWTVNGLAFAAAASLYLWLGSVHEERRLLRFYGEAYRAYAARTPRFLPRLRRP